MKNFEALNKAEVVAINGGLMTTTIDNPNTLPIIPFGDPSDWDTGLDV